MRIVAAMSGGVDSSVVAGLLQEAGHEVIGVHMKLHDVVEGQAGHCCGLDDVMDARDVADTLGIPFYVMDLREAFRKAVMDDFAANYLAGRTPNPCVRCGAHRWEVRRATPAATCSSGREGRTGARSSAARRT